MTIERVDLMRRFITFIDVMYEHKVGVNYPSWFHVFVCQPTIR
jgi:predicted ATPase